MGKFSPPTSLSRFEVGRDREREKANANGYGLANQVFAEVVASLSAFSALLYMIPFLVRVPMLFVWDTILFVLWIALFGLFGNVRASKLQQKKKE